MCSGRLVVSAISHPGTKDVSCYQKLSWPFDKIHFNLLRPAWLGPKCFLLAGAFAGCVLLQVEVRGIVRMLC